MPHLGLCDVALLLAPRVFAAAHIAEACLAITAADSINFTISGIRFRLTPREHTWDSGRTACQSYGMDLASISTQQWAQEIHSKVQEVAGTSLFYWIGGNDTAQEGAWLWTDGSAFSYEGWGSPGRPADNADLNCLGDSTQGSSAWQAVSCSNLHQALCASMCENSMPTLDWKHCCAPAC